MDDLRGIIEALIFASDHPLPAEKIGELLPEATGPQIKEALGQLVEQYRSRAGGLVLSHVAGGYQLRTKEELAPWIVRLKSGKPPSLSTAALETLAIIAYRQPIVKGDIERLRGVDVSAPLKGLLEKKLVRIMGRKDVPGRPIIYGTTRRFLEVFGLKDLSDLPSQRELKDLGI